MNRNTLLITIAAIVVVGIAAGLLASGALNSGSLSGSLEPTPTSINLSLSGCSPVESRGVRQLHRLGVSRRLRRSARR